MKNWLEKLDDPSRDIYERRYRMISAIAIIVLLVWITVASIVNFSLEKLLFFAVSDLLFIPTMIFTLKTGKVQLGAGGSALFLVFVMIPVAFFYNGGIQAGAPNWCIIAMVFITMTVHGRFRDFLLIADILVTAVCYVAVYTRPEIVEQYAIDSYFVDSLASLIITLIFTAGMFIFQLHISNQERDILRRQQKEIADLNRSQNRFFSSMSHEIRTPVNTIIGLNEMILRENISDEVLEDARNIEAASRMLLQAINDILEMSKLESGRLEISKSNYRTVAMLSDIVNMIWVKAKEKGLEFNINVDPDMPSGLYGDEMRVKQVLINVLTNAVKYTPKGSVTLTIQAKRQDDSKCVVTWSVSDTGVGIKQEDIPYLFTAFKRADEKSNQHIEGTGLGLSIVKQLLDLMGGSISVNSIYTKGSTFVIELPQGISDPSPVGQTNLRSVDTQSRSSYQQSFEAPEARILAVDDTLTNLMVVKKLLRDTRVKIDTATSGAEALEMTLNTPYDLILMDHRMPEMDGIECLHRIRRQPGGLCRECPILALTANVGSEMERLYRQEGFNGYIVKPVKGDVLEREVMSRLPEALVHATSKNEGGDFQTVTSAEFQLKRPVLITADSSCDLPRRLAEELEIGIIPFYVRTENALFLDGDETESKGLIAYMESGRRISSIPPSKEEYENFFADRLLTANHIIHITASDSVGKGYKAAFAAAETFNNVIVYDGGHLSSGTGLLAIHAGELAQSGRSADEIISSMDEMKQRISTSFIIDDVNYLYRSGRASKWTKMVSEALMLHPGFAMINGKLKTTKLYIGQRDTVRHKYIADALSRKQAIDDSLLFITHAGVTSAQCREIEAEALTIVPFKRVIIQDASSPICESCGPGTFGLLFRLVEDDD